MSNATRPEMTADDAMAMAEQMADEIARAGRKSAPVVAHKTCRRCQGKGEAHFIGTNRAPGICFGCAGSGKVPATKADMAILVKHHAAVEVERLRVLYRGHLLAVSMLRGGMTSLRWGVESEIESHERQMASIVEQGKAAKLAA
jgi:hypothetical protein